MALPQPTQTSSMSNGGAQSMRWWANAVNPELSADERARNRMRLLRYNEDDVAATRHIRGWLDINGPKLTCASL